MQERWLEPDAEFLPDKVATNGAASTAAPKDDDLEINAAPSSDGKVWRLYQLQEKRINFQFDVSFAAAFAAC